MDAKFLRLLADNLERGSDRCIKGAEVYAARRDIDTARALGVASIVAILFSECITMALDELAKEPK